MIVTISVACIACACAAVWDMRVRRIPNLITMPLVAIALVVAAMHGWAALAQSFLLLAVLLAGGLAMHTTGWLGGGDIKLAIGISLLLGYPLAVDFLLFTAISGGVLALGVALSRKRGALLAGQLRSAFVATVMRSGTVTPLATAPIDERIPYALAIAAGLAFTLVVCMLGPSARFGS